MVQPSSIDVRIDRYFRLFDNHKYPVIDPAQPQPDLTRLVEVAADEPFVLHPGEFVLASTFEVVTLPDDVAARLEGKSSLGRLGLLTHSTAGFIDPGFSGHVTLELCNVATLPIMLWPGMKIGQLCFFRLSSAARAPVRQRRARIALPGPARADGEPLPPVLPPHAGLRWPADAAAAAPRGRPPAGRASTPAGWSTTTCCWSPARSCVEEVDALVSSRCRPARLSEDGEVRSAGTAGCPDRTS